MELTELMIDLVNDATVYYNHVPKSMTLYHTSKYSTHVCLLTDPVRMDIFTSDRTLYIRPWQNPGILSEADIRQLDNLFNLLENVKWVHYAEPKKHELLRLIRE